jgi:tRNA-dihydrouridine synthase A
MIGREAYQNPWPLLSEVDQRYFGIDRPARSRMDIAEAFIPYLEQRLAEGAPLYAVAKHLLGLFHGQRGGKQFRRYISENGHAREAGVDTFRAALALVAKD